jgi:hypothetical protein
LTVSPRWGWLALVFLTTQLIYLHTLNPTFSNDDSAETITAGATLGLQHPPGYALAAILDRCESFLPLASFGFRANWGGSLFASSGAVLLTAIIFSVLNAGWFFRSIEQEKWIIPFCAVMGGLGLAFSPTYWQNALSAKGGIYLLGICLQLIILCRLVFAAQKENSVAVKILGLSFFLMGLGLANHWETVVIFIPALLLFFIWTRKTNLVKWIQAACFLIMGVSPLLYLALRGHLVPVLNLGAPDTISLFLADLSRNYFNYREMTIGGALLDLFKGSLSLTSLSEMLQKPFKNKTEALCLYLGWEIGWLGFILALFGVKQWFRSSGKSILYFILLSWFLVWAINFSYFNISQTADSPYLTIKFFLSSDWMIFLLSSIGMVSLLNQLNHLKESLSLLMAFLLVCCLIWKENNVWNGINQSSQTVTYDYGQNLLKSLPVNSLFFAESDADYFSLYYLQQVEHRRPDVIMIPTFTLFESWGTQAVEKRNPDLGLTASSVSFPDHFARIIYASSELVAKNRIQRPIAFSNFNGAFHLYFMNRQKNIKVRSSGLVWLLDSPIIHKDACLLPNRLRTRDIEKNSIQWDGSLDGIRQVYALMGLNF